MGNALKLFFYLTLQLRQASNSGLKPYPIPGFTADTHNSYWISGICIYSPPNTVSFTGKVNAQLRHLFSFKVTLCYAVMLFTWAIMCTVKKVQVLFQLRD